MLTAVWCPADARTNTSRFWVLQLAAAGRITAQLGARRPHPRPAHRVFVATHPGIPWLNGRPYIDVLHPKAAAAPWSPRIVPAVQRHFGTVIPGVFTDEPHFEPCARQVPTFSWPYLGRPTFPKCTGRRR